MGYFENIDKKLKEIQRSDEKTKQRWLIFLSSVSMALVILLWVLYLKASLPTLNKKTEKVDNPKEESIWTIFREGLKVITKNMEKDIGEATRKTQETVEKIKEQTNKENSPALETQTEKQEEKKVNSSTPLASQATSTTEEEKSTSTNNKETQ